MNLTSLTKKFHLPIGTWMKLLFCLLFSSSVLIVIAQEKKKSVENEKREEREKEKTTESITHYFDTLDSLQIYKNGYNVLFEKGTTSQQRQNRINALEKYYIDYYNKYFPGDKPTFNVFQCRCDSLLVNFNVTVVDGTGVAVTPTPPLQPTGGSGDIINSNKSLEQDPADTAIASPQGNEVAVGLQKIEDEILAIIDTGLDPRYFKPSINKLIWQASGSRTMFDFTINALDPYFLQDDNKYKHGTTVTGIALMAMSQSQKYPKLMILKALDSVKKGSTFTVSCAMSYAIQHNAKIINTSLGYYSSQPVDTVLKHYISLTHNKHILIFTAAGNTTDQPHDPLTLCLPSLKENELMKGHFFYPACLTTQFDNIISVTGIANYNDPYENSACHYQNFSGKYVSVGVINKNSSYCCKDTLKFYPYGVEGTSFVTPVFSGYIMNKILNYPTLALTPGWLDHAVSGTKGTLKSVTQKGRYIINPIQ